MNSTDTKAAKRPKINSSLSKMMGAPHDISSRTGGDISGSTKAASRPDVNSTISGKHFFCKPNNFTHKAIGGGGSSTGSHA